MSKKAAIDGLGGELDACARLGHAAPPARRLVARLLEEMPEEDWREFRKSYPMGRWLAFALPEASKPDNAEALCAWFAENPWGLDRAAFIAALGGELLRSARSGAALCVMLAAPAHDPASGKGTKGDGAHFSQVLRGALSGLLEACDTLAPLGDGVLAAILPGMGQLKSRKLAENLQKKFKACAGDAASGERAACAIGLVNVAPGECAIPEDLLQKAEKSLALALEDEPGHIYQESPAGDACGATLVHSHEKHFLFFGGDPQ